MRSKLLSVLVFCFSVIYSQARKIETHLKEKEITYREGEFVFNILKVINLTNDTLVIKVNSSVDEVVKWLSFADRKFTLLPLDSVFVPLRYMVTPELRGNTRVIVNIAVLDENDRPIGEDFFYIIKKGRIDWEVNVLPSKRIYFPVSSRRDEETLKVQISNTCPEDLDLTFDFQAYFPGLLLKDVRERRITRFTTDLSLKPYTDTTFIYTVQLLKGARNYEWRDWMSYDPFYAQFSAHYLLFFRTYLAGTQGRGQQRAARADIIKLPSVLVYQPYRSSSIPSYFDVNVYNILSGQPVLALSIYGNGQLDTSSAFGYNFYTVFPNFYVDFLSVLRNTQFSIYYRREWWWVQAGGVSGGYGAGGYGLSLGANYHPHSGSVFIARMPYLWGPAYGWSTGFNYSYQGRPISGSSFLNYVRYLRQQFFQYQLRGGLSVNSGDLIPYGRATLWWQATHTSFTGLPARTGHALGLSYGLTLNQIKLNNNTSVLIWFPYFQPYNRATNFNISNYTSFGYLKDVKMTLGIGYLNQDFDYYFYGIKRISRAFNANLNVDVSGLPFRLPSLGYSYQILDTLRGHIIRGNWSYGSYDYSTKSITAFNVSPAYIILSRPYVRAVFNLQTGLYFRYLLWRFLISYNYNIGSIYELYNYTRLFTRIPQSLRISLFRQIQFKEPRIFMDIEAYYTYMNSTATHNAGITPYIYYISYSGWRFRTSVNYNVTMRKPFTRALAYVPATKPPEELTKTQIEHSIFIEFGLRKEFGLPIPFKKERYYMVKFQSFIDLNGDRKMQPNEPPLPDVIIKILPEIGELMTDTTGKAIIKYLPSGSYPWSVTSINELKGYFPYVPDSIVIISDTTIYIPFVKAIKIYGKVALVRERIAEKLQTLPVDLSGIRITVIGGDRKYEAYTSRDGNYSVFVPYGEYTVSVDESILGMKFFLLKNNIPVKVEENMENIFIPFTIVEKERKVLIKKFNNK